MFYILDLEFWKTASRKLYAIKTQDLAKAKTTRLGKNAKKKRYFIYLLFSSDVTFLVLLKSSPCFASLYWQIEKESADLNCVPSDKANL